MTSNKISRRAAIGGAAIVGLVSSTRASAAAQQTGISPALENAFRTLTNARAAVDRHHTEVHTPAHVAYEKARWAVPHRETTRTFVNAAGEVRTLSTADPAVVATARSILKWVDIDTGDHDRDWVAVQREVVELNDQRMAELGRLRDEHAVDRTVAESNALSEACNGPYNAVIETPALSFADLLAKLQFMADEEEFNEWAHGLITADVRRIAGVA